MIGMTSLRRLETSPRRPNCAITGHPPTAWRMGAFDPLRPYRLPYERTERARKRSSAEAIGCAMKGRSRLARNFAQLRGLATAQKPRPHRPFATHVDHASLLKDKVVQ